MGNHKKVYQLIVLFSLIVNLFLIGLMVFIIKDSVNEKGDFALSSTKMYYAVALILGFTIINGWFYKSMLNSSKVQK